MKTEKQSLNYLHRGMPWLALLIFFTYSLIRWTTAWSPVHETKQYLLCAIFGSAYAAATIWFVTLPIVILILVAHQFTKRRYPKAAVSITVASLYLLATLLTEFGVLLAMDS